jgi:hypothetical protein
VNGLTLLAPVGLFALAALAVPLIIHLFSRSRGKRVLVGNIALYRQVQRQRVTRLRLVQWLLLILRLVLLALVALLLAGLARKGLESLPGNTAYVTPEWLEGAADPAAALAPFDSTFVLGPAQQAFPGLAATDSSDPWSLLAERLAAVQHAGEVHVFAQGRAGQFPDAAPAFGDQVQWHLDPESDHPTTAPALSIQLLHAPEREGDAAELLIALEALATHRNVVLALERGSTDAPPPPLESEDPHRVMIWLDNRPAPRSAVEKWGAGTWLEDRAPPDAALPGEARLPRFPQLEFTARPAAGSDPLPEDETVLWWTRDGRPLLRMTVRGVTRHLVFEDRLGGAGLTAEAAFPEALLRLLLGEDEWRHGLAHAPADPGGALGQGRAADAGPNRPLGPWLALAIALLFMVERWLSERPPPRTEPSGAP